MDWFFRARLEFERVINVALVSGPADRILATGSLNLRNYEKRAFAY